jgi:hypothetical protein
MGLMTHSIAEIPIGVKRGYYLYLLDYGWAEPLYKTIERNFEHMAKLASKNDAVIIKGIGSHFADEVLSWHKINGQTAENLLPAILLTTIHPALFREGQINKPLIIIPLRQVCKNSTDVVELIEKLFNDIKKKKKISDFEIVKTMKKGKDKAIVDALILQPNIGGIGIDLKKIITLFKNKGGKKA